MVRWTTFSYAEHGYFSPYLYRIGEVEDSSFVSLMTAFDDVIHTFLQCYPRIWERQRLEMEMGYKMPIKS